MVQYKYHRAVPLDDVVNMLREYGGKAHIIAGGTDILVQIRERDKRWKGLRCPLDITYLDKELCYISEDEEYICIDPLSTHTGLEQSKITAKYTPFLRQASATVGFSQIRNHGILGRSTGNGFPASDPLPALAATDALIRVYGQDGEQECLLENLYEGEGSLKPEPGEFIREFVVEKLPEGTEMGFPKLGRRKALAISRPNCTATFILDSEGAITEARIAPGCILVQPDRMEKAEQVLTGQKPSEEPFAKAGKAVSEIMIERTDARWSTQYKESVIQEVVLRALCQTAGVKVQQWRR